MGSIIIYNIVRFKKYKGFKGAIFGANIIKTFDEVLTKKHSFFNTKIRVHLLKRDQESLIGIELDVRSLTSIQIFPALIDRNDAIKLQKILQEAIDQTSSESSSQDRSA